MASKACSSISQSNEHGAKRARLSVYRHLDAGKECSLNPITTSFVVRRLERCAPIGKEGKLEADDFHASMDPLYFVLIAVQPRSPLVRRKIKGWKRNGTIHGKRQIRGIDETRSLQIRSFSIRVTMEWLR